MDKLEKDKDDLYKDLIKNNAFTTGNKRKLAQLPCSDVLQRRDGLKKISDKRQQIQDECFNGNPTPEHDQAIANLDNGIKNMDNLAQQTCGPAYVP